jgi:hypothetical protein
MSFLLTGAGKPTTFRIMSINSPFPQGWYPVPDSNQERFWDGERWTNAYRHLPIAGLVPQSAKYNGLAVASMVLGIVSLVLWYVGIVTGIVSICLAVPALKKCAPNGPDKGRNMAIAGLVCSIVALSIWLIGILVLIASST